MPIPQQLGVSATSTSPTRLTACDAQDPTFGRAAPPDVIPEQPRHLRLVEPPTPVATPQPRSRRRPLSFSGLPPKRGLIVLALLLSALITPAISLAVGFIGADGGRDSAHITAGGTRDGAQWIAAAMRESTAQLRRNQLDVAEHDLAAERLALEKACAARSVTERFCVHERADLKLRSRRLLIRSMASP